MASDATTFEPVELLKPRPIFDMAGNVRMSNIKPDKSNVHVETVRAAVLLSIPDPDSIPKSYGYDYHMVLAVQRFQLLHGFPVDGVLTRDQVELLSTLTGTFAVVA
jgi:murein L,D-transpeptidase YcbB/YkuD